jgi:hypothetical protein
LREFIELLNSHRIEYLVVGSGLICDAVLAAGGTGRVVLDL